MFFVVPVSGIPELEGAPGKIAGPDRNAAEIADAVNLTESLRIP